MISVLLQQQNFFRNNDSPVYQHMYMCFPQHDWVYVFILLCRMTIVNNQAMTSLSLNKIKTLLQQTRMDDTTMYITEIFLNWFYRLITYVKLLIFLLCNVKKMDPLLKCVHALNLLFTRSITVTFPFPNIYCLIS